VNYAPNARLEDRLHPLEPPYRSRGEAQVGRLLDREQIPFLYEQPTLIYDRGRHRIWRPDFTLPTYGGLIVEYAGMMDVPDYAAGIEHKAATYRSNEIPAVFVYPEDLCSGFSDPEFSNRAPDLSYPAGMGKWRVRNTARLRKRVRDGAIPSESIARQGVDASYP
jgi:hypothetical protein